MDDKSLIDTFAALAQPTRLEAFRLLVRHEPDGLAAGEIARCMDVPQNTMSAHLAVLARAGLINSQRHSRSITYRADIGQLQQVLSALADECCGGQPDLCAAPACSTSPQHPVSPEKAAP
jgi:DNA-binding transcriptional ArsR family regulator